MVLYLVLEGGFTGPGATQVMGRGLKRSDRFIWLEPPRPNGTMTVLDVVEARDLDQHQQLVDQWARDVWKAWAPHHAYIRKLAHLCLA